MGDIKNEIFLFLSKIWVWIAFILIGVLAKFSYEMRTKKYTFWSALSAAGVSIFIGYLTSVVCYNNNWIKAGMVLVPMATFTSEKIVKIIIAEFPKFVSAWLKNGGKSEEK